MNPFLYFEIFGDSVYVIWNIELTFESLCGNIKIQSGNSQPPL
jgi:hypothetical protein